VRLRPEEYPERQRLAYMPAFQPLNQVRGIKPGATVLARVSTEGGAEVPALVEQRFGQGRAAALLIGDLWRWQLRRERSADKPPEADSDLDKAWRQTIRWLVSDGPSHGERAVTPRA